MWVQQHILYPNPTFPTVIHQVHSREKVVKAVLKTILQNFSKFFPGVSSRHTDFAFFQKHNCSIKLMLSSGL